MFSLPFLNLGLGASQRKASVNGWGLKVEGLGERKRLSNKSCNVKGSIGPSDASQFDQNIIGAYSYDAILPKLREELDKIIGGRA